MFVTEVRKALQESSGLLARTTEELTGSKIDVISLITPVIAVHPYHPIPSPVKLTLPEEREF
ncbi:hypothetical protein ACFL03_01340 [Thermodesulfobacteriota bacterium]